MKQYLLHPFNEKTKGFFLNPFKNSQVFQLNNVVTLNTFRLGEKSSLEELNNDFLLSLRNFIGGVTLSEEMISMFLTRALGGFNEKTYRHISGLLSVDKFYFVKEKLSQCEKRKKITLGYIPLYFNDDLTLWAELTLGQNIHYRNETPTLQDLELYVSPVISLFEDDEKENATFYALDEEISLFCQEHNNYALLMDIYALQNLNLFILPKAKKVKVKSEECFEDFFSYDKQGERLDLNSIDLVFEQLKAEVPAIITF